MHLNHNNAMAYLGFGLGGGGGGEWEGNGSQASICEVYNQARSYRP